MATKKYKKLHVVYAGECLGVKGYLLTLFLHKDEEITFKNFKGCYEIGKTYILETSEDTFKAPDIYGLKESPKQVKVKDSDVEKWCNDSEIAEHEFDLFKERKRIDNSPSMYQGLSELGDLYYRSSRNKKDAIELGMLRYLRRYTP